MLDAGWCADEEDVKEPWIKMDLKIPMFLAAIRVLGCAGGASCQDSHTGEHYRVTDFYLTYTADRRTWVHAQPRNIVNQGDEVTLFDGNLYSAESPYVEHTL